MLEVDIAIFRSLHAAQVQSGGAGESLLGDDGVVLEHQPMLIAQPVSGGLWLHAHQYATSWQRQYFVLVDVWNIALRNHLEQVECVFAVTRDARIADRKIPGIPELILLDSHPTRSTGIRVVWIEAVVTLRPDILVTRTTYTCCR
ncbi:hypothetical protein D3C78_1391810 [compost metagenome]